MPQYLVRLLPWADSFFLPAVEPPPPPGAGMEAPRHAANAAAAASLKELSGAVGVCEHDTRARGCSEHKHY